MSNLHDYYLQNLGIGEIWKSRESSAHANDVVQAEAVAQKMPSALTSEHESTERESADRIAAPTSSPVQFKSRTDQHGIDSAIQDCQKCGSCRNFGKTQFVMAPISPDILLISEFAAPLQLDAQEKLIQNLMVSLPLPSAARKAMTLSRTSMLKACAPASPELVADIDDAEACLPFLQQEIEVLRPRAIFVLGERIAGALLGRSAESELTDLRSARHLYQNIPVFVTHSALALLTDPRRKSDVWNDICKLNDALI
ncbi:uracil-DNA glycosylase family protein [Undibacterium flavidum]|uniref:Uracil-DNA glycosylase-like domain-containing protein n=1 Tax=Undibacterium flavidum TaxID=2762297 RepID=A0ABR6YEH3_9BURK|nr:uracil-DNA glycosylase family protein [Undibacterium flavidum]MBC3874923.1 hypothetical protein [Undibacterium flavidum]